jgi:Tol biopolymer transport system component
LKALTHYRSAALRVAVAVLFLSASVSAFVSASSLPTAGHTGQALELKAALHPNRTAAQTKRLMDDSAWHHFPNGRFAADPKSFGLVSGQANAYAKPHAAGNAQPILINEGVQTFDVFAPPPSFAPTSGPLTPIDLEPVWTADENYIIFSSNRAGDNHFHLFAIPSQGGLAVQLTTGSGDEYYPALNKNNSVLAFTSSANSTTGNQDLYIIGGQSGVPFTIGQAPIDPANLAGNAGSSLTLGDTGVFTNVTRPTLSPAGDRIVFSATTSTNSNGHTANIRHLYYLYVSTHGYDPTQITVPGQLTDGPAADTDPAWSPKGDFIAFASNATGFTNTGTPLGATGSSTVSAGSNITPNTPRALFLLNAGTSTSVGTVPASLVSTGGLVSVVGTDNFGPAWSADTTNQYTNPNTDLEYLAFARGAAGNQPHDIYYFLLTTNNPNSTITISPETANNAAIKVNTDDNAGETTPPGSTTGNVYDDIYPSWSPFLSVFSIVYQSPRSITYNSPQDLPLEVAQTLIQGATNYGPSKINVGSSYVGILESQVLNLDPPTLLRYDGSEVVRITDASGAEPSGRFIQPGQPVTFTVRLSNREAGTDDTGATDGSPNVYLQIKDPDSKYQDSQNIEHKIFARTNENPGTDPVSGNAQATNGFDYRDDSGSASAVLFNGGSEEFSYDPPRFDGYNFISPRYYYQFGSVGGFTGTDTISVGHMPPPVGGVTPGVNSYVPWGPEYECQYLNPTVANPGTALGDYGTPFYLAGVDDQTAFSGSNNSPRPIANDTNGNFAEWLQLTKVPTAQQDGLGGVLYSATYTAPSSPSDYYLDVIAYDKAVFPALTSPEITYSGQSKNWRIYDNVGGYTTTSFNGSNDILVVSDYALGQKFSATTFGGEDGNSNLQPTFYGAESYYTDVDEALLPNASDYYASDPLPTIPTIPGQVNSSTPLQVSATAQVSSVVVEWAGNFQPTYNIYRTLDPNAAFPGGYTLVGTVTFTNPNGTVATTFTDNGLTNGTTYYYRVTSVSAGGNESLPSPTPPNPPVGATPENFGGVNHNNLELFAGGGLYQAENFNVLNGLGVGSYIDGLTDDGGTVSVLTVDPVTGDPKHPVNANLPNGASSVPYVRSQKYSLWRILSRGPISSSVLAGYQPTFQSQPAVSDPTNNVTASAESSVPVAQRCVIWVAPYSGNLPLVDSGSIENPSTQQTLQGFLQAGGRLCLTGANVASALSLKGTGSPTNTGSGAAFLSTYLQSTFLSQAGGGQVLGGSGARITGNSGFNAPADNFPRLNSDGTITLNVPPASDGALLLGNDFDGPSNWRADGSLDQLGPNVDISLNKGGVRSAVLALAQINTITPSATATTDMTTNGAPGLIYHEDYTDTLGSGYGSRIVFGSFGLEGISTDYYEPITSPAPVVAARNQRQKILHNIVSYLRTGTFTIHVTQASGQGLAGATVYLKPNGGTLPGPRQVFSASDPNGINTAGNYVISGVEPGSYVAVAYKTGFTTTISNLAFEVEGDTSNSVGLVLAPVPPGRIQGTVTDNAGNDVAGASVTFTSTDGQITYTATTASDGTYKIDPAAVGTYNGTASKLPQYTTATAPTQGNPITVPSGGTGQADFVLQAKPATVSGTVFNDLNGDGVLDNSEPGVAGATVTFTPQNSAITTPGSVTTDANGLYTITGLAPGTYTITVTATGFLASTARTVTVAAGDTLTGHDVPLIVAPTILPGTIGGLIADAFTGNPLGGATVTIVNTTTGTSVTTTSSSATSTPGAPSGDGAALNYGPVSVPPGTYNVTVTLAGYGTQSINNVSVVANTFTRVDFTSANGNPLEPVHVFPSGYNFFSVPYDYSAAGVTIDEVFGTLNTGSRSAPSAGSNRSHLFVWSPVLLQYVLDPTPPADGLHLGQGYWVYLNAQTEITRTGNLPTTVTIPVGLHQGWNMIGVPSLTPISASRLTFSTGTGGGSITFAQASSNTYHLVSPTMYGYSGGSYFTVSGTGTFQPWQSYWIYAFTETTILIPTGGG